MLNPSRHPSSKPQTIAQVIGETAICAAIGLLAAVLSFFV